MKTAAECLEAVKRYNGRPLRLMEVCGTHTESIFRCGLRDILPQSVRLISGPGCPVCVTPAEYIDTACRLSRRPKSVVCAFGDMLRVPGTGGSLTEARAAGGSVRLVYSPMDILPLAEGAPDITFYMTAVGFETTLPIYALLLEELFRRKIRNIRLLTAARAIVPALRWICARGGVDGFIGPGHVSAVIGTDAYQAIADTYKIPVAVAGFEFGHLAAALSDLTEQCNAGTAAVKNLYPGVVTRAGNTKALALIDRYFILGDACWRGLGTLPGSGYGLRPEYAEFDAGGWPDGGHTSLGSDMPGGCRCGAVLIGEAEPTDCPLFGSTCTPREPVGPCMVSSEGACGIYYRNRAFV